MAATALTGPKTAVKNLFSIFFFYSDPCITNDGLIFINDDGHRTLVRVVNRIEDEVIEDRCAKYFVKCLLGHVLHFDRKLQPFVFGFLFPRLFQAGNEFGH